jgi:hypothetical protein
VHGRAGARRGGTAPPAVRQLRSRRVEVQVRRRRLRSMNDEHLRRPPVALWVGCCVAACSCVRVPVREAHGRRQWVTRWAVTKKKSQLQQHYSNTTVPLISVFSPWRPTSRPILTSPLPEVCCSALAIAWYRCSPAYLPATTLACLRYYLLDFLLSFLPFAISSNKRHVHASI